MQYTAKPKFKQGDKVIVVDENSCIYGYSGVVHKYYISEDTGVVYMYDIKKREFKVDHGDFITYQNSPMFKVHQDKLELLGSMNTITKTGPKTDARLFIRIIRRLG